MDERFTEREVRYRVEGDRLTELSITRW
jgi:hypothetical protein